MLQSILTLINWWSFLISYITKGKVAMQAVFVFAQNNRKNGYPSYYNLRRVKMVFNEELKIKSSL